MTTAFNTDAFDGEGLACRRGGRLVFAGLNFRLERGRMMILKGPNGSGKSTLLRLAAGLLQAEAGRMHRDSCDVARDPEGHHDDLHFIGHKNAIKATLSVRDNLTFWAGFASLRDPDVGVGTALDTMGLRALAGFPAGELSAGQQRRLALARLFLRPAGLWLLDEPTVGLDQISRNRLADAMKAHLAVGGMIMAATHMDLGVPGEDLNLADFAPRPADDETEFLW